MFKKILTSKTIILSTIIYIIAGLILWFTVPKKLEFNAYQDAKKNGVVILNTLEEARQIYNDSTEVILNKYKDISLSTKITKDTILYPSSFIHKLNNSLSKGDIKLQLYSKYPFKNTKGYNRILTDRQESLLRNIRELDEFTYSVSEEGNKKYYIISKVDYMSSMNCVKCHNNHPDRTQHFNWKLNDPRGILEIKIPIDSNLDSNITYFNIILFSVIFFIFVTTLVYYAYNIYIIKNEAQIENEKINNEFTHTFKELNFENSLLEKDLKQMRGIFDNYIIYSKTDLFGTITDVSKAFCELSGYKEEELLGENHNIVRHPDMPASAFKGMWGTIENNKVWVGDVKNAKKDGGYYWVHAIVAPSYDNDDVKIGYISIRQDITDKMKKLGK